MLKDEGINLYDVTVYGAVFILQMFLALSLSGTFSNASFFSFHLLNIVNNNQLLSGVIQAVTQNGETPCLEEFVFVGKLCFHAYLYILTLNKMQLLSFLSRFFFRKVPVMGGHPRPRYLLHLRHSRLLPLQRCVRSWQLHVLWLAVAVHGHRGQIRTDRGLRWSMSCIGPPFCVEHYSRVKTSPHVRPYR